MTAGKGGAEEAREHSGNLLVTDAERWEYLERVRQGAIRAAIRARALQGFSFRDAETVADEMVQRLAVEVTHLESDLVIMPERKSPKWKQAIRRLAVLLWRVAS